MGKRKEGVTSMVRKLNGFKLDGLSLPSQLGPHGLGPPAQPLCVRVQASLKGSALILRVLPSGCLNHLALHPHPFFSPPHIHLSANGAGLISKNQCVGLKERKIQLKRRGKLSENLSGIGFCQNKHSLEPLSKCHLTEALLSTH